VHDCRLLLNLKTAKYSVNRCVNIVYLIRNASLFPLRNRSKGHVARARRMEAGGFYTNQTLSRRRAGGGRRRNRCRSIRNLTSIVERSASELKGLENRYRLTQSALNDVTGRVDKMSAAVESSGRFVACTCIQLAVSNTRAALSVSGVSNFITSPRE